MPTLLIAQDWQRGQLAGGITLVPRRGKIVFLEPFGSLDKESAYPMKHDSIFRIASDHWQVEGIQHWYTAHLNEPIRETVKRMAALPFNAQPGDRLVYG